MTQNDAKLEQAEEYFRQGEISLGYVYLFSVLHGMDAEIEALKEKLYGPNTLEGEVVS